MIRLTVLKPFTYNQRDYSPGTQDNFPGDVANWLKDKSYAAAGLTIPVGGPLENEPTEIPDDLFDVIIGHDKAKYVINRCLRADKPVHVLLSGSPATAKSLFVMEICRLPKSRYALGSTSSKAGIVDFLLEQRPRYLIVDELERMPAKDQSALLSLMETGIVTRLKKGMRERIELNTLVFATCNRLRKLPPELRSRFWILRFREYSRDEFRRVVVGVLVNREGTSPELASYIAERMANAGFKDVRDSVRLARLAKTREEIDEFLTVIRAVTG